LRYAKRPISKNNFTKIALKNRKNRLARPFKFRFLVAKFKKLKRLNFDSRQKAWMILKKDGVFKFSGRFVF